MVIKRSEMQIEEIPQMKGGEGTAVMVHIVNKEQLKNARLMSECTLAPGCSIGEHKHDNETEYFIIIHGSGTVIDDRVEKKVKAGDVIVTGNGSSHSIINTGSEPLVFHAIIITY
jgi:mannose-6-phosphate isomerase-like protein (cupin superfamily)